MPPSEGLAWVLALTGWCSATYFMWRIHKQNVLFLTATSAIAATLAEANELLESVYRVRLSCPACDWTDTVVRESRDAAILEGNNRISTHNEEMGHILTGEPKTGYFKGEPLN